MDTITAYALSQSFRITSANRNRRAARCWGCDAPLPTDTGHEVRQMTMYGRAQTRYLCRSCLDPILTAHVVMSVPATLEPWWSQLFRPRRTKEERRALPRPGAKEIDALIAEREK